MPCHFVELYVLVDSLGALVIVSAHTALLVMVEKHALLNFHLPFTNPQWGWLFSINFVMLDENDALEFSLLCKTPGVLWYHHLFITSV